MLVVVVCMMSLVGWGAAPVSPVSTEGATAMGTARSASGGSGPRAMHQYGNRKQLDDEGDGADWSDEERQKQKSIEEEMLSNLGMEDGDDEEGEAQLSGHLADGSPEETGGGGGDDDEVATGEDGAAPNEDDGSSYSLNELDGTATANGTDTVSPSPPPPETVAGLIDEWEHAGGDSAAPTSGNDATDDGVSLDTSTPTSTSTLGNLAAEAKTRKGKQRVLVTGGAGFVGSHLVDRLLERGDEVIVIDNFFTGRKDNLLHHKDNPRLEVIRHDVVDPFMAEVDQIYHLACPASPVHYKYNPVKTVKTNVMGTMNMLGLARRTRARFLLTSTSEVYGDPLQHPQNETYWGNVNPIGERSCYDEGKRTAETLTFDYQRQMGLEVRVARIFNTYGPRMGLSDGRVVSNFVRQALNGEEITIYGDGSQTRSFQYVDDLVRGLMTLMDQDEHTGPFNIGNPGEFTMNELAEVVKELVDPDAKVSYVANTPDDPSRRRPDIGKAKKLLGWEPTITLRDGLPSMIDDFRKRIEDGEVGDGETIGRGSLAAPSASDALASDPSTAE